MTKPLREAAEAAMKVASELFEELGSVSPVWIIDKPDGSAIVHGEFHGDETKDAAAAAIRQQFGATATRIIFISEAWVRIMEGPLDGIPPSEHPDRIEIIHLMAEDRGEGQISIQRIIDRSSGQAKLLRPQVDEYSSVSGRFASFFQRTEKAH